jgi:IS1 family transposase
MRSRRASRTKNWAYVVTEVDRATRCILGGDVVWERTRDGLQDLSARSPQASQYYSAAFPTYGRLVYYPGKHAVAPGKSQTYAVEADNAALRPYLARLARRSRCFARSIDALRRAVKLFV